MKSSFSKLPVVFPAYHHVMRLQKNVANLPVLFAKAVHPMPCCLKIRQQATDIFNTSG